MSRYRSKVDGKEYKAVRYLGALTPSIKAFISGNGRRKLLAVESDEDSLIFEYLYPSGRERSFGVSVENWLVRTSDGYESYSDKNFKREFEPIPEHPVDSAILKLPNYSRKEAAELAKEIREVLGSSG